MKTVEYRPQANRTERVNRYLVQMIANYLNDQHDTWNQFLREFAYAIRTAVNETTGKIPAELFLGRKLITLFQKLVVASDGTEFAVGDIERFLDETRRNTKPIHEKWEKYCNRRRRDVQIKVNDWVLIKTHPLSLATKKVVAKFKPKFEGRYKVLELKNNNVVIWRSGKRLTVNVDQVRIYRHRKSDDMEIRTATRGLLATDHVILNHGQVTWTTPELAPPLLTTTPHQREDVSALDRFNVHRCPTRRVFSGTGIELMTCLPWLDTLTTGLPQPLPGSWTEPCRKLKMSRKETIVYKRSRDSGSGGPEKKQRKRQKNQFEKDTLISSSESQGPRKKYRGDEIAMPSTSGYNLRPKRGAKVEPRPIIEMRT
ncbi:uncharacterized protein TNCV_1503101 [Trichonephila clavipes]|uniref:Uncharacterized protein n=1 Tax=Trichonephila clavipes TaxID=2585209 RepID=A0A8X6V8F6_TRICX|nr:uncharacterized protein TNCV_1503101 [Trichonephila clavipes]